jgi:hypothetical protein
LIVYVAGRPFGIMSFDIVNGRIGSIWTVINPE